MASAQTFRWGALIALLYVISAVVSFRSGLLPVRPLYDGGAPPAPYRWANPPPDLAAGNQPPRAGTGTVVFTRDGSEAASIATDDAQAIVIFPGNTIEPRDGERRVNVTITPVDPAALGAPPQGTTYDSNAYEIAATYEESGEPAALVKPASVILRYAFGADRLLRRAGGEWQSLGNVEPVAPSLQITGDTPTLGVFVAAGPPVAGRHPQSRTGDIVAAAAGVIVVVGGLVWGRRRALAARRAERLRQMGKKAKRPRP